MDHTIVQPSSEIVGRRWAPGRARRARAQPFPPPRTPCSLVLWRRYGTKGTSKPAMTASTTGTIAVDSHSAPDCGMDTAGRLDTVLVKTASRCNIDCSYCYVYQGPDTSWRLQPKRMRRDVVEAVCERLIEQAERQETGFAIVLHGESRCCWDSTRSRHYCAVCGLICLLIAIPSASRPTAPSSAKDLLDLFAETRTSVSVSIDGPPEANDLALVGPSRSEHIRRHHTGSGSTSIASHSESEFLFAGTLSVIQPETPSVHEARVPVSQGVVHSEHGFSPPGRESRSPSARKITFPQYGIWSVADGSGRLVPHGSVTGSYSSCRRHDQALPWRNESEGRHREGSAWNSDHRDGRRDPQRTTP